MIDSSLQLRDTGERRLHEPEQRSGSHGGSSIPPHGDEATGADATKVTRVAIFGAIGLLDVAAWWMVRGSDRSGPVSRTDDDWPGHSGVI